MLCEAVHPSAYMCMHVYMYVYVCLSNPTSPVLGLQTQAPMPRFLCKCWNLASDLYDHTARILQTEPSLHSLNGRLWSSFQHAIYLGPYNMAIVPLYETDKQTNKIPGLKRRLNS